MYFQFNCFYLLVPVFSFFVIFKAKEQIVIKDLFKKQIIVK